MDNPTTLLVAIMYVTIVATGLINILMTLSDIVGGKRQTDPLHTGWIVLLLLIYLGYFWHTTVILDIEGWDFLSFLMFIFGPVVLFFATNLIVSSPDPDEGKMLDQYYFEQSGRFFLMLALVQAWVVGLDIVFKNIQYATYFTAGIGLIFILLLISKNYRVHIAGLIIAALGFIVNTIVMAV